MKLFLKCIIATLFISQVAAQTVFLPNVGTKWSYLYGSYYYMLAKFNAKIEYKKDSTYNGENVKILQVDRLFTACSRGNKQIFIKQRNDSVYFLGELTNNTWQLLIDYNATTGQSWTISILNNEPKTYTIVVNSISTATLNNMPLKKLDVVYKVTSPLTYSYSSFIYERLGDIKSLFNFTNTYLNSFCDYDYLQSFLCYQDSTFGLMQFASYDCNYSDPIGVNELKTKNDRLMIYPNPSGELINIELLDKNILANYTLKLTNILGKEETFELINKQENNLQLNVSQLKNGIYFLQVFDPGKLMYTEKIVKE